MENNQKDIAEQIIDYTIFFRNRGYLISPDFPERFFSTVTKLGIENSNMESLEPYLRTMTVQTAEENADFPVDFDDFIHNRKKKLSKKEAEEKIQRYNSLEEELSKSKKRKEKLEKEIEKRKKELEKLEDSRNGNDCLEEKKIASLLKERKAFAKDFEKLASKIKDESMREAVLNLKTLHKISSEGLEETVKGLLRECIGEKNGVRMMKHLEKIMKARKAMPDPSDSFEEENIRKGLAYANTILEELEDDIMIMEDAKKEEEESQLIKKLQSYVHREEFKPGTAVQTGRDLPQYFRKEFVRLTNEEKEEIKAYIFENAREFRTRMARNIRTGQRKNIDMAETCKEACATGGVPMRLCYEKPVRSKANLVMLLDISGSCKEASEMMLYFMYCMHEVFPGGCRAYVFVNSLYDISEYLESGNPTSAVEYIFKNIPVKGVYSDYYTPLRQLYTEHMSEINKDSLVFFIGDARNNKNQSGEEYLREICRRCRKAVWLNTDMREKWDQGDSIIGKYRPYLRAVDEVLTPEDLLKSLDGVRTA